MRCSQAQMWISTAIDGEAISPPVLAALTTHLTACETCRAFSARERERSFRLARTLEPRALERTAEAILLGAREEAAWSSPAPSAWRRWSLAAAAAALAVAGLLAFRFSSPPEVLAPPGKGPVTVPADTPSRPLPPIHLIGDERRWTPVPGADGSPWSKETRRVRELIIDPMHPAGGKEGGKPGRPRLELELNGTRYLRLVDFPYQ